MAEELDHESVFDGAGFTPATDVADPKAAWEAHTRAAEPAPEAAPAPEQPAAPKQVAESDIAALRAAGWSDADIKDLSPEAAARHALREGGRVTPPKTERAVEPSGPDDLEALLAEEFSSKTAKKLAPILRAIREDQAALSRSVRDTSLAGIRDAYQGQYPELARPEVERAVLSIAGPAPSKDQYGRALRVLYGNRQAPDERSEARAQVSGQMTAGRRGPAPVRDSEAADRAAWAHYVRTGNADQAVALRGRLGGQ